MTVALKIYGLMLREWNSSVVCGGMTDLNWSDAANDEVKMASFNFIYGQLRHAAT